MYQEPYCIADLVAAESPSQARYIAWKNDVSFTGDLQELPKFSVRICLKGVDHVKGIVTNDKRFQDCWKVVEESEVKRER